MIAVRGALYGTTFRGGAHSDGVVFRLTTQGKQTVLDDVFSDGIGPAGSLLGLDGVLYGTTSGGEGASPGGIFAMRTNGTELWRYVFTGRYNGRDPYCGLIDLQGALYGTTVSGGNPNVAAGTFFRVTRSGKETRLYAFQGAPDGANPEGNLVAVKDTLYGTTASGGGIGSKANNGTVFSVTRSGVEKVIYAFGYYDGAGPAAGLVIMNGIFYGTTAYGGAHDAGTVFSITTAGQERLIHSFGSDEDGKDPVAPLIAYDGVLYGTTAYGGTKGMGTVFEIDSSGKEQVLHDFNETTDGSRPTTGLIAFNGVLYGTTSEGPSSSHGHGTVFALTPQ